MTERIPILVNDLPDGARADEADVLVQAQAVEGALTTLGYETGIVEFATRPEVLSRRVGGEGTAAVFNLVEAVNGENRLQHLAPLALQRLGYLYTGNSSEALMRTTDKTVAKEVMVQYRVRTPWWMVAGEQPGPRSVGGSGERRNMIFKPVNEDASLGIREELIGPYSEDEALDVLGALEGETGMQYMAEEYIAGREFNVSLIEAAHTPCVLPIVEQDFAFLPPQCAHVVGYRAKWVQGSVEYTAIPRKHHFSLQDRSMLEDVRHLALRCWRIFHLSGYARVDVRVDAAGTPYVLEVNANPCLSPDAGFAFAASLAGLSMTDVVRLVVDSAIRSAAPPRRARAR